MKKGKLICACNQADKKVCAACSKGRRINPDEIFYIKTWKRSLKYASVA